MGGASEEPETLAELAAIAEREEAEAGRENLSDGTAIVPGADGQIELIGTKFRQRSAKEKTHPVCGAKTRGGKPCQKPCIIGRTRCRLHGGLTPRGKDCANYKHGLYSSVLPKNLRSQFNELVKDPKLTEGRAEFAILQLRLKELVARLDSGENAGAWEKAREQLGKLKEAEERDDEEGRANALASLSAILEGGANRERAWSEATDFIENVSKAAERENKRAEREKQTATLEEVRLLVSSITNAVMLHVTDAATRIKIAEHINRLRVIEPIDASAPFDS